MRGASAPGSPAEAQQRPMGAVGFTVGRAQGHGPRRALNGHGKLPCGMGFIRQRRKQNGEWRALLSSACGRLWRVLIARLAATLRRFALDPSVPVEDARPSTSSGEVLGCDGGISLCSAAQRR
jgi:hypothetical protein